MNYAQLNELIKLTKLIEQIYKENGIKMTYHQRVASIEPILKLNDKEEEHLLKGDGQSNPNEYKQINSSTGLAVNYFKILDDLNQFEKLTFEEKVAKPLKERGGLKANIDVLYEKKGVLYYIESKFLEPYYSENEKNKEAYFDTDRYPVPDKDKTAWYDLLKDAQSYKYYNFSQLCRHLLAIWRNHKNDPTKLVLQSVTWRMPDAFINHMESEDDKDKFRDRRKQIKDEAEKCQNRINTFLKQIEWNNIEFQALYYNDILDDISSSPFFEEFKKRYML